MAEQQFKKGEDYTIVGLGPDGQPMVFAPSISPLKPITMAEYQAAKTQQAGMSGPQRFLRQAIGAAEAFAGAGGMGATQGMMLPGPRGMGGLPGPAGGPVAVRGQSNIGPALTPPSGGGARVVQPNRMAGPAPVPTYTPEVVPGPSAMRGFDGKVVSSRPVLTPEVVPGATDLRAFSGRVTNMPPRASKMPGSTPALPGPAPSLPAPTAQRAAAPSAWGGMEPGGMSGGQVSQMDAAASGIANAFGQTPMIPTWMKAAGGAAVGAGIAGLAGYNSIKDSLQSQPPQPGAAPQASAPPQFTGQDPQAMSFMPGQGKSMAPPQPGMSQQPAAPAGPQRGPTRPMGGHRIAGGAAQGVAGAGSSPGQQAGGGFATGGGNPRAPAANYYSDMLGAADSGDAYARDLVNLTSQARQVAFKANQEGKHLQFVPLHDMRNNRLYLVNANGQDVVLDLNDEGDKAAFGRMTAKIGIDPASIMAWAQKSSRPLHRYMVPPGSQGDWAPQFGEPGQAKPTVQLGSQAPDQQEGMPFLPMPSVGNPMDRLKAPIPGMDLDPGIDLYDPIMPEPTPSQLPRMRGLDIGTTNAMAGVNDTLDASADPASEAYRLGRPFYPDAPDRIYGRRSARK